MPQLRGEDRDDGAGLPLQGVCVQEEGGAQGVLRDVRKGGAGGKAEGKDWIDAVIDWNHRVLIHTQGAQPDPRPGQQQGGRRLALRPLRPLRKALRLQAGQTNHLIELLSCCLVN